MPAYEKPPAWPGDHYYAATILALAGKIRNANTSDRLTKVGRFFFGERIATSLRLLAMTTVGSALRAAGCWQPALRVLSEMRSALRLERQPGLWSVWVVPDRGWLIIPAENLLQIRLFYATIKEKPQEGPPWN